MKKQKIAFVIPSLAKGGAERVVVRLAEHMALKLELDISIIFFYEECSAYVISDHIKCYNLNLPVKSGAFFKMLQLIKRAFTLRSIFKKMQFDKIYCFLEGGYIPAILTGYPVVISCRSAVSLLSQWQLFLYRFKNVKKIVAQTEKMKNDFSAKKIKNVIVIGNPIDFNNVDSSDAFIYKDKMPYYLAVGRYDAQKNFPLLIEAFSKTECKKKMKLLIAGSGNERENLLALIKKLNLQESVFLVGEQSDHALGELYIHAHATVLSSDIEGFPNALLESLSYGTPVISTASDGASELVIHHSNGLLSPVRDPIKLQQNLDLLASNNLLRKKLSNNARSSVSRFSIENVAKQWLELS